MNDKLKECPFCGDSAELELVGGDDMDYVTRAEISCDSCYAEICVFVPLGETRSKEAGDKAKSEAIRMWNTRRPKQ